MIEQWVDIPGFAGRYLVSDQGRIMAAPTLRTRGGLKTFFKNKKGHCRVDLYFDGRHARRYVHRLVLEAFVGRCPDGMECCHNDGNPSNNRLNNLRWDTPSSNWEDARKHGTARTRDTHHWTKISKADIATIRDLRKRGLLQREIAARFKVCQQAISHVLRQQ